MTVFKLCRTISLPLFILLSCTVSKTVTRPTLEELQAHPVIRVPASELVNNKAKYQGQYIETQVCFRHAFEECAIYYDDDVTYGDTSFKVRNYYQGIWIDFNYHLPISLKGEDSLQDKFITVKGYFDTTRKGHLGQYAATLVNTFSITLADSLK